MNRSILSLILVGASFAMIAGCSEDGDSTQLSKGTSRDPNGTAGGQGNTQEHNGNAGGADPGAATAVTEPQNQEIGSAEVVARLHHCGKIQVSALSSILGTRGVDVGNQTQGSAGALLRSGQQSLGAANYAGRVNEASFWSTSSMAKAFDVFIAASGEVQANLTNSTACQGVTIADAQGKFNKDGISCIIGKPARGEHVTLANQAVTQAPDVNTGIKIAISALLSAAHSCE